ncbi:MAG: acyl-CoA thioesterase [Gammaproteobacteria bacterium]|nr:acyl-CoA thioesterase [Gammaproteobacteria bacterium]
MNKIHKYIAPVRFTHTDPAGYVFFPRFFEMFQACVEDWFNNGLKVDYAKQILEYGVGLPTANIECTFSKPCKLGELIEISLSVEKIGNSSITINFQSRVNNDLRLKARSVLVAINTSDGRPIPLKDKLRQRLTEYIDEN